MAAAAARKSLTTGISCHAFNGDGSQVALSPNNNELHVYATHGSQDWAKWERLHVLAEHGGLISSVDWSASGNAIVTCGHDRNAYVWKYSDEKSTWTPTLVICRLNRAATCVRWDPAGTKFAVASGSKTIAVCYYEASNDWYIAKTIKKHKSTVTSVAFSPNGKLLVTGCTDNKARICSAYVKGVDSDADDGFAAIFPNVHKFGEVLAEIPAGSWVNAVAWAPGSGHDLAFATHGSTVGFVRLAAGAEPAVQTLRVPTLPYQSMAYADENTLVAAGWSNNPAVYTKQGDDWVLRELLDKEVVKAEAKTASKFGAARAMFAASASKGVSIDNANKGVQETKLNTRHQNSITSVFITGGAATTAGVDGNLFFWAL